MTTSFLKNLKKVAEGISQECKAIPALLTQEDRSTYFVAASELFTGQGIIVDAGAFLGGTAYTLAEGLEKNKKLDGLDKKDLVLSLDMFEVVDETWQRRYPTMIGLGTGDCFQHLFTQNVSKYSNTVSSKKVDLTEYTYTDPRPIEILGLDVLKSSDLAISCFASFLPHLIPGVSFVLHQDHVHATLPFTISAFHLFSDILEPCGECVHTAVFKCVRSITREDVLERFDGAPDWDRGSKMIVAIEHAIENSQTDKTRLFYRIALANCYRRVGAHFEAEKLFLNTLIDERAILADLSSDDINQVKYYIDAFLGKFPQGVSQRKKRSPKQRAAEEMSNLSV